MKIEHVIWLEEIIEKLDRKHNVQQDEVKELLDNEPHFRFVEKGHRPEENVYAALGQTEGGRYMIVFFVYKRDKSALVLSAREMTQGERRRYEQR